MNNRHLSPSKSFLAFFRWFCNPRMVDDIEGDLLERFESRAASKGHRAAKRLFIKDVLLLFRPGIIRSFKGYQKLNYYDMFKNYLKTARRNFARQKMYSFIKVGGFAMGIAACLLITLYIRDELSYDRHYDRTESLYRITQEFGFIDGSTPQTWLPAPFAQAVLNDFPQIEMVTRVRTPSSNSSRMRPVGEIQNSIETGIVYVDSTMLDLLEIPMMLGDRTSALKEELSMVISREKAEKFFPGQNPIGKIMILNENESRPLKISGVMDSPLGKSHLEFDYLISLTNLEFFRGESNAWGANNFQTYVKLQENTDPAVLAASLHQIATKHLLPFLQRIGNVSAEDFVEGVEYTLQPIADVHLNSNHIRDPFPHGNLKFVQLFGVIAGLILMIAVVNFVNLSTAKSANRAKEVGLRKTIGSLKSDLIFQFLIESIMYSLLALILATLLAYALLPYFNTITGKNLNLPISEWWFAPAMLVFSLGIGLLAGAYPAFYLSSFKPIQVLKGSVSQGSKKSGLREILVVFQFATSVALIIATIVVSRQMNFIMNTEIGYDKEQVITLSGTGTLGNRVTTLKNELLNISGVENLTISGYLPVDGTFRNDNLFWMEGRTQSDVGKGAQIWRGDYDYITTLGIQVIDGRNFSREMPTDTASIIINRQMAKNLGLTEPLGKKITNSPSNNQIWTIIGVVEDFNYESLKGEIGGLGIVLGNNLNNISIKVSTQNMAGVLEDINKAWEKIVPEQPLAYDFLSDRFARMYDDVLRTGSIFKSFAIFAISVACLGLFGLSVYMVEQRNKEISIRLVLGASINHILASLGFNFLKPVLIALLIAIPLAWYLMREWLNEFQYKTSLSWDIFVIASIAAVGIAVLTVSYNSLKAALTKPVNGLRSE